MRAFSTTINLASLPRWHGGRKTGSRHLGPDSTGVKGRCCTLKEEDVTQQVPEASSRHTHSPYFLENSFVSRRRCGDGIQWCLKRVTQELVVWWRNLDRWAAGRKRKRDGYCGVLYMYSSCKSANQTNTIRTTRQLVHQPLEKHSARSMGGHHRSRARGGGGVASHLPLLLAVLTRNENMGRRFLPESPRTTIPSCARRVRRPSSASASSRSWSKKRQELCVPMAAAATAAAIVTTAVGTVQFKDF